MEIIHYLDTLLYTLFPNLKIGDNESIRDELIRYYSIGSYQPEITIAGNTVTVRIDTDQLALHEREYKKAISLCESRNFKDAKILLSSLIEKNPSNSDFYRILGQIISEEGDQETAINYLIESLKWDNKNKYALIMMGNIYFQFKHDPDTALIYFNQVLKYSPDDYLALNNIGSQLGMLGKIDEAKSYLEKALLSNPEFPNTYLGLGLINDNTGRLNEAFNHYGNALKYSNRNDQVFNKALNNLIELSTRIVDSDLGETIFNNYKSSLESRCGIPIDIKSSSDIPYYAKIEYAEIYDNDLHIIKYKPAKPGIAHLVMHELTHLKFAIDARETSTYKLIVSDEKNKKDFYEFSNTSIEKLRSKGIPETDISNFVSSIQEGLISQIFNTPIDLFIEDFLFNTYEYLRPYQFISLYGLMKESILAVTDSKILEITSEHIVSKSKIFNLVSALQFRDLFYIDFTNDFDSNPKERKLAESFYKEFLKHKDSKLPGIEYELIENWANRMDLYRFFSLIDEKKYLEGKSLSESFDEENIESDPVSDISDEDFKMAKFLQNQEIIGLNKSIIFYMIGALEFFRDMPLPKIKEIAMEIARIGMNGISPEKEGYTVSLIHNKTFSGNHLLAYYYVSWKLAIPDMVDKLQLPFRDEYNMAEKLFKGGK